MYIFHLSISRWHCITSKKLSQKSHSQQKVFADTMQSAKGLHVSELLQSFLVRDAIINSHSDFLQKSQTPVQALWSLRSIDHRVIFLHHPSIKLRMPQNASLVPLIGEPIRVNAFFFVIYKRGNSQYREQFQSLPMPLCDTKIAS